MKISFINKIWHYTPMISILMLSSLTYLGTQKYFADNAIKSTVTGKIKTTEPLYEMDDVVFYDQSITANNKYTIKAKNSIQFAADKSFLLNNILISHNKDQQNIKITAIKSTIDSQINTIMLDNCFISNINLTPQLEQDINIQSDKIIFYPKLDTIESLSRAVIRNKTADKTDIFEADNIIFNNISKNIEFKGRVFGIIQPKYKS